MPTKQVSNSIAKTVESEQSSGILGLVDASIWNMIAKVLGAVVVLIVMLAVSKFIASAVRRHLIKHAILENKDHITKIADLVGDIIFYVGVLLSLFVGFQVLGFDVSLILGGVSFGVGLAFKETLGNMIAGVMILTTKHVRLGDIVEINTEEGYFGKIEEINVRTTTLRTFDLRQVILPNTVLIDVPIKTYTAEDTVRMQVKIGIHYDASFEKARDAIVQALNQIPFIVNKEKIKAYFGSFRASSMDLLVHYYINPSQCFQAGLIPEYTQGIVTQSIIEALRAADIKIPYPHLNLTFDEHDANMQTFLKQFKSPSPLVSSS